MSKQLFTIEGISQPLQLIRSKKARYMRISINASAEVKVTIPWLTPAEAVYSLVHAKKDWILQTLAKIAQNRETTALPQLFTEQTVFNTRSHRLQINAHHTSQATIKIGNGLILVNYPHTIPISNPKLQDFIKKGITEALRIEAKHYLPKRLSELAMQHHFLYNDVFIKNLKSKWGSCSHQNNINLNLHLMRLPDKLIDYVLVHELTHTVVKNHSADFWNLLQAKMPDAKARHLEMKKYNANL
ncbi:M48 family peptidase [Sphingobacteriales bacterium UPWRP_1]|nr:hypothetical protein BVG80_01890 [Sphingobacteriales bacterium TSM_CSM]PSJ75110.1 M48 family peptidase [Sphingobacteriales bacterium UPWRP_1]